jgi:hypothetical protein
VIKVASINDIVINLGSGETQFNDATFSNDSRAVDDNFAEFAPTTNPDTIPPPPDGTGPRGTLPTADGRVFLGTVTFQTFPTGGTTTLTLSDIPPDNFADVITFAGFNEGYVLDPQVVDRSLQVVPVPEPGAVLAAAAVGLAGLGAIRRARRGWRAASVGAP